MKALVTAVVLAAIGIFSVEQAVAQGDIARRVREYKSPTGEQVEEWLYPAKLIERKTFRLGSTTEVQKIELIRADGSIRIMQFEAGKVDFNMELDPSGVWRDKTFYKNGVAQNKRQRRNDKGLDIRSYHADGKTVKMHQSWRYEPQGKGQNGRTTEYLLESVEEYDDQGILQRELQFHSDGKTVKREMKFKDDGTKVITTVRENGWIENYDFVAPDGKKHEVEVGVGVTKWILEYKSLTLDPQFGEDEPEKVSKTKQP